MDGKTPQRLRLPTRRRYCQNPNSCKFFANKEGQVRICPLLCFAMLMDACVKILASTKIPWKGLQKYLKPLVILWRILQPLGPQGLTSLACLIHSSSSESLRRSLVSPLKGRSRPLSTTHCHHFKSLFPLQWSRGNHLLCLPPQSPAKPLIPCSSLSLLQHPKRSCPRCMTMLCLPPASAPPAHSYPMKKKT